MGGLGSFGSVGPPPQEVLRLLPALKVILIAAACLKWRWKPVFPCFSKVTLIVIGEFIALYVDEDGFNLLKKPCHLSEIISDCVLWCTHPHRQSLTC